jgi:TolB protein
MKKYAIHYLLLILILFSFQTNKTFAALEIDLTEGNIKPLPIAISFVRDIQNKDEDLGINISKVIASDLAGSGLFYPINPKAFLEEIVSLDKKPNFNSWRVINTESLLTAQVYYEENDRFRIQYELWDVVAEKALIERELFTSINKWRSVAHVIADAVYARLTGESGYFDTKIAFIAESGSKINRIKRLAIMDQDGYNPRLLTTGNDLVLTPRFSPNSEDLVYLSYRNGQPQVYIYNVDSNQTYVVGSFPGMSFAPRFSPDGMKIMMSLQEGVGSNIFEMNLSSFEKRRLTNTSDINTAPSYSPDAKNIVFESDKSGTQQLYVMDSQGNNVRRISYGTGSYSTPVWSPRGDYIAFTKISKGRFMIGIMFADGSGERIITDGYHNEGPTWAPNGRVLMFFRESPGEKGGAMIYSVDVTGYNERLIDTPGFASDPSWSALLH